MKLAEFGATSNTGPARSALRVTVVVATYRRPESLVECIAGLAAQHRRPDEVVIVRRLDDEQSAFVIRSARRRTDVTVREVLVEAPGVVAALQAGAAAATGDVLAFTDDDAVPRPDWLDLVVRHFDDPRVGVVGGRDVLERPDQYGPPTRDVGRVTSWGRLVGNHHRGVGGVRDVDVVKGVNLAVRRAAGALPVGLRGRGAQPHWEVALCRWAQSRGWRVVYDSSLLVDHRPAHRPAGDKRSLRAREDVTAEAFNLVAALRAGGDELRWRRAAYGLLVGDRAVPGLLRAARSAIEGDKDGVRALLSSLRGQTAALRVRLGAPELQMRPVEAAKTPVQVVLVAHDVHDGGGMERVLAQLVRTAGPDVRFTVLSATLTPDLAAGVRWLRVRVPRRPFPLRYLAFQALAGWQLWRLRRHSTGRVLVHTCGAIVPNRVDVATVHFCHAGFVAAAGALAPTSGPQLRRVNTALTRALSIAAERWSYRPVRTEVLAAVSAGVAEELETHYPGTSIRLTPNGVDVQRFVPEPSSRNDVRAEAVTADGDVVALFVGGDWARKGVATAIAALAIARRQTTTPLHLWVVGPGDVNRYRSLAADEGVADAVRFFGSRKDTERFYGAADVFLLPTLYEAHPLVALEAAAASLPLVITRVNGAAEVIGDGEAGLFVDPTPDSVAAALIRLAEDPGLRRRLGASARARVRTATWEASAERVVDVYRALVGESIDAGATSGSARA